MGKGPSGMFHFNLWGSRKGSRRPFHSNLLLGGLGGETMDCSTPVSCWGKGQRKPRTVPLRPPTGGHRSKPQTVPLQLRAGGRLFHCCPTWLLPQLWAPAGRRPRQGHDGRCHVGRGVDAGGTCPPPFSGKLSQQGMDDYPPRLNLDGSCPGRGCRGPVSLPPEAEMPWDRWGVGAVSPSREIGGPRSPLPGAGIFAMGGGIRGREGGRV